MRASEVDIRNTMLILSTWNPLGDRAAEIEDLDSYRSEARDILFHIDLRVSGKTSVELVQSVLNTAFDLTLTGRPDLQTDWTITVEVAALTETACVI